MTKVRYELTDITRELESYLKLKRLNVFVRWMWSIAILGAVYGAPIIAAAACLMGLISTIWMTVVTYSLVVDSSLYSNGRSDAIVGSVLSLLTAGGVFAWAFVEALATDVDDGGEVGIFMLMMASIIIVCVLCYSYISQYPPRSMDTDWKSIKERLEYTS
jgi:hypothetical protein